MLNLISSDSGMFGLGAFSNQYILFNISKKKLWKANFIVSKSEVALRKEGQAMPQENLDKMKSLEQSSKPRDSQQHCEY